MSKYTKPPLDSQARSFTPVGNLTCNQRLGKAKELAERLHPAIVIAWVELAGARIGWIQSTIYMDRWSFMSTTKGKASKLCAPDWELERVLPGWAKGATVTEIWVQPVEMRGKAEIARDQKQQFLSGGG